MNFAQQAAERIKAWRSDAIRFVREQFGAEPDAWQREYLRAHTSEDPKDTHIVMQACAGPGKSTALCWGGWHFLLCQGDTDQHPNGYAISITGDNLKDNLWKEFAVWRGRSPMLQEAFEMTSEKIFSRQYPATWWIKARTWSKTADADAQGRTLSGLHSPYIWYGLDEIGDMAPQILRSAEQGLSTGPKWGKIEGAGNPTSLEGMLYQAVTSGKFHVIRITGDPDDPNRSSRIDIDWAREQIAQYGRENPWVMSYVLGQFPPSSINALLGPDDIYAAFGRGLHEEDYTHVQKRLGIDVARFGNDRTVIFPRQGLRAFNPVIMRNARSHDIAARIAVAKNRFGSEAEYIDDTGGYGAGTSDACLLGGIALIPINFGGKSLDPRYYNRRSEMHFKAAEWVKRGGSLPQGLREIVREATAPVYWYEKGKLRVEEKDQIKIKLGGLSPDLWDSFVLTHAHPDMPAGIDSLIPGRRSGRSNLEYEYDPFEEAVPV